MLYNKFDSYYYSRPVSYKSYYPKLTKTSQPLLLGAIGPDETGIVLDYFRSQKLVYVDKGGLDRGIVVGSIGLEVSKRTFNHNSLNTTTEYLIYQWKPTNDLGK